MQTQPTIDFVGQPIHARPPQNQITNFAGQQNMGGRQQAMTQQQWIDERQSEQNRDSNYAAGKFECAASATDTTGKCTAVGKCWASWGKSTVNVTTYQ